MSSEQLTQQIRSTLTPDGSGMPGPSIFLHLRPGVEGGDEWAALERFLGLVASDADAALFAGFFRSGGSEPAGEQLRGEPDSVCLRSGTDWDWMVWRTSISELADLYRQSHTWPDLLFPPEGGWMLETPPSDIDSFLYPMKVSTE